MAEVRKHRPRSTGSIGDQVRASINPGPRPLAAGEAAPPSSDPFVDAAAEHAGATPAAAGFAVTGLGTEGWFSIGQDAVQTMMRASRPVSEPQADQPDEDED